MTKLTMQEKIILARISAGNGRIERIETGRRTQPFKYYAQNWGEISPGTFSNFIAGNHIRPIKGAGTVLSMPRFYEVVQP